MFRLLRERLLVEESHKMDALWLNGEAKLALGLLPSNNRMVTSRQFHESPLQLVVPLDEYDDETGQIMEIADLFRHYPFFTDHTDNCECSSRMKRG